ncbi:hypothetical protein KCP69_21985 [Salmonella enterica subsp. enterica]|nr:hypothetical protein KCP69_21985 [Salmonella enterica subsp. enterica]
MLCNGGGRSRKVTTGEGPGAAPADVKRRRKAETDEAVAGLVFLTPRPA